MKIITVLLLFLAVVGGLWWQKNRLLHGDEKLGVHYHAGFLVFKNGIKQDFSDLKYMEVKPCGEGHEDELTPEEIQIEKAHLHDGIGDVVHVHRDEAQWGDLFTNIGVEMNASVAGYINNQSVHNILDQPIVAYDSVVMIEGDGIAVEDALKQSVSRERIVEAEQKSENCGV